MHQSRAFGEDDMRACPADGAPCCRRLTLSPGRNLQQMNSRAEPPPLGRTTCAPARPLVRPAVEGSP